MKARSALGILMGFSVFAPPAFAKDVTVTVDGRAAPWSTGANAKMRFGLADARPSRIVIDPAILPGVKITFKASGSTFTYGAGSTSFGPDGDRSVCGERGGLALFPTRYTGGRRLGCLNELIGAFITADGIVVGKPFVIGAEGAAEVPDGAAALSLGVNDDRYADNGGTLTVQVHIPEAQVIVEDNNGQK